MSCQCNSWQCTSNTWTAFTRLLLCWLKADSWARFTADREKMSFMHCFPAARKCNDSAHTVCQHSIEIGKSAIFNMVLCRTGSTHTVTPIKALAMSQALKYRYIMYRAHLHMLSQCAHPRNSAQAQQQPRTRLLSSWLAEMRT